jgi:hypothetical protein
MNIPLDKYGKVNYPKIISDMWHTKRLFYRPDPLGFCVIQMDMYNLVRIIKMPLIERQKMKGYM